jgi:hypothetical protein
MRKVRSVDIIGDDPQRILADFDERIAETGIQQESDIISIQHESIMMGSQRKSVLRIFYWAND